MPRREHPRRGKKSLNSAPWELARNNNASPAPGHLLKFPRETSGPAKLVEKSSCTYSNYLFSSHSSNSLFQRRLSNKSNSASQLISRDAWWLSVAFLGKAALSTERSEGGFSTTTGRPASTFWVLGRISCRARIPGEIQPRLALCHAQLLSSRRFW